MPSKYVISLLKPLSSVCLFPGSLARYRDLFKAMLVELHQAGAPRSVASSSRSVVVWKPTGGQGTFEPAGI